MVGARLNVSVFQSRPTQKTELPSSLSWNNILEKNLIYKVDAGKYKGTCRNNNFRLDAIIRAHFHKTVFYLTVYGKVTHKKQKNGTYTVLLSCTLLNKET